MSERWFRVYEGLVDDPKVQRLSGETVKGLLNLWCLASRNGGALPTIEDIAFSLRMATPKVERLLSELRAVGLLDEEAEGVTSPHNWDGRQFKSDTTDPTAAQRMRKHRRNATVTQTVTPPVTSPVTLAERSRGPETDTEKNREVPSEQSSSDASAPIEAKPAAASAVESLPAGDLQDFWRIAGALELRKLPRSRAGQLLNLLGLTEALEAIRGAERSRNPAAYVGKTIDSRRKEQGGGTGPPATNGSMPPWIAARKNEGHDVQREGKNWRVDWALYDDSGECIGS